jgi:hypothetical protein
MKNALKYQEITILPLITKVIDGTLQASKEQLNNMRLVVDKPNCLDEAMLKGNF